MTGYLSQPSNPISILTIASLEDIGYTVDYSGAGAYDGSDTTCCNNDGAYAISGFEGDAGLPPPTLSDDGRADAVAYGQELLLEYKTSSLVVEDIPDGLMYMGDSSVVVLYEEDGQIFEVVVNRE
mmetsp:Transcript_22159/g.48184  ORF Transcript_22159/g.48184 Transcript_22159/m.48184 type:complete len:125 (+) Transcript_22159:1-375(+)